MAHFQYIALDAKGEQTTGSVQASSEAEAITQIRSRNLYPTQVVEEGKGSLNTGVDSNRKSSKPNAKKVKGKVKVKKVTGGTVKPKVMMVFTRQLATLIESGLPLLKGLDVLGKQEPNPVMRNAIHSISDSVSSGSTLSESLSQHPRLFNKLYVNMVRAGELGGVLEVVLERLADYQEKANKLKNKIVSAMIYPLIVLFITVAILVFLMVVVVPRFRKMFDGQNISMPGISKAVFGFSDFMLKSYFYIPVVAWIAIVIFLGFLIFKSWTSTIKGKTTFDGIKLKIPLLGDLQLKSAISRFSRTLGTLVTSGVPILQALKITSETAGNQVITDSVSRIHDAVKEGESIVTPMMASSVFPPMVIGMIDVGEETGKLPDMLLKIADVYDDEVDNAVTALTSVLEPIMIVMLALVVGTIVLAMFLPLMEMINSLEG